MCAENNKNNNPVNKACQSSLHNNNDIGNKVCFNSLPNNNYIVKICYNSILINSVNQNADILHLRFQSLILLCVFETTAQTTTMVLTTTTAPMTIGFCVHQNNFVKQYTYTPNQRTLTIGGRITVRLVSGLTRLELNNEGNIILFVFSEAV